MKLQDDTILTADLIAETLVTTAQPEIERRILAAAADGKPVDLCAGDAERDDPAGGASWEAARTVSADVLIQLLDAHGKPETSRPKAVTICGARITGSLDLHGLVLACPVQLRNCFIEEPLDLSEATALSIRLPGCHLSRLAADQLRTAGDLELDDGFTVTKGMSLAGARVGGVLSLRAAHIANSNDTVALAADQLTVDQHMHCHDEFTAEGEINLLGAHIGGRLDLTHASLNGLSGTALRADGITVDQSLIGGFAAQGEVRLPGARIGGGLDLSDVLLDNPRNAALTATGMAVGQDLLLRGAHVSGNADLGWGKIEGSLWLDHSYFTNPGGTAVSAGGLTVGQDILARELTAKGTVALNLNGAHVGAGVFLADAHLSSPGGPDKHALSAAELTVGQTMICEGLSAEGDVFLAGAQVSGILSLKGAHLANPDQDALVASDLKVGANMSCEAMTVEGRVSMPGAQVSGGLGLSDAHLSNRSQYALGAPGLEVGANMVCRNLTVEGCISMPRARIGGSLNLTMTRFSYPTLGNLVLNLEAASVAELVLKPDGPHADVILAGATVGAFYDDQQTWPHALDMKGFTYQVLGNDEVTVKDRLRWLKLQPGGYVPQIYDQLADCYRQAGNDAAARRTAIAKQWRRRHAFSPLNWLWYITVGYGYRTWLAGLWLAGLAVLGTVLFSHAYPRHFVQNPGHQETFSPFGYTLDVLLPIVDLGQKSSWTPLGYAMYWSWALTLVGWVLVTAAVAGLTSVLKRG